MLSSTPLLVLFLVSYVFFCGFIMYFCVIADPDSSNMAYLIQVVLPNKVWSQMTKVMGEKRMDVVQAIVDRFMVFVYLAVILGSWTIVFWYIYPWISRSSHVSDAHKIVGYVVFVACIGSWRMCNKTRPGIITAKNFKRFDHYPYDNLLFLPNRRCDTTNLIRIPRSKFDRLKYNQNVPRYDHFCGWVFNTIGAENYRWFLLFLTIHVVMCVYGACVCSMLFYGEIVDKKLMELVFFDRATGESVRSNYFIVSQYMFTRFTPEFAALLIMLVMGIALGGFLSFHLYLVSVNQTTNENGKWSDVKRWHKSQTKKYKHAVKNGLIKPASSMTPPVATNTPEVQDGDVTCTGGSSLQQSSPESQQQQLPTPEQEYFDPGPMPKNVYDRGFIENWKEVLFPLSKRKNALELAGYSRPRPKPSQQGDAKSKKAQPGKPKPRPAEPVTSDKTD